MLTGAHAHADALSVTLFSQGRELLVDPGTFVYNCAPEWRSYFRSTRAHNTVTIDGRDQAEQGGTFHWKTKLCSRAARELTLPGIEYMEAEHDGYRRMPQGVIHRRRLLYVAPESWIVVDDFRGSGEHSFDFHYHFPDGAPRYRVFASTASEDGACRRVGVARIRREEALLHSACHAYRSGAGRGDDLSGMPSATTAVRQLTVESGSGIACSYRHQGFEDIVVLSTGDSEMAVADFRMRGEFFWLRLEGGVLKQVMAVRACGLDRGGKSIFRRSEPGLYVGVVDAGSEEKSLCAEFAGS